MKHSLLLVLALLSFNINASVSIQNFSSLHEEENVFRGREPGNKIKELKKMNITDVIIFKNDTKGEVEKELNDLESLGMNGHHIPFQWKDIPSMQVACEQVIEALTIIKNVREEGGSVYFHCTAGEDRTGLLAGLFQMLNNGIDQENAFAEEMCAKSYSDGNPRKPISVTAAIEKGLTPLFLTLASKIENGELSLEKLDKKVCRNIKLLKQVKTCR
jgi:protein tyrosine/serine phosphatase